MQLYVNIDNFKFNFMNFFVPSCVWYNKIISHLEIQILQPNNNNQLLISGPILSEWTLERGAQLDRKQFEACLALCLHGSVSSYMDIFLTTIEYQVCKIN